MMSNWKEFFVVGYPLDAHEEHTIKARSAGEAHRIAEEKLCLDIEDMWEIKDDRSK